MQQIKQCGRIRLGNIIHIQRCIPSTIQIRSISRIDLKRPKLPHKEKAIVLQITKEKFRYPLDDLPPSETCVNSVKEKYSIKELVGNLIIL